jgi:hypothetical protein
MLRFRTQWIGACKGAIYRRLLGQPTFLENVLLIVAAVAAAVVAGGQS